MSALLSLDPLGSHMEQVIAALPSQQERDEFTLFIEEHLKRGTGAGILRGLFLLLKANRCYLEKLPEQFKGELVQPIIENMLRLETSIGLQIKSQDKALVQTDRCVESATDAADRMEAVVPRMEKVVQVAFDKIDPSALTRKIEDSVLEGAVRPVAKVNDKCDQLQDKLEKRGAILAPLMKWGTVLNMAVLALTFALVLSILGFFIVDSFHLDMTRQLQDRMAQEVEQVHATAQVNSETLETLARLNVQIVIAPEKDWLGNLMPNHYCLAIQGADDANMVTKDGQKFGAIFFKEQLSDVQLYPNH
jgi:hypothetical protein